MIWKTLIYSKSKKKVKGITLSSMNRSFQQITALEELVQRDTILNRVPTTLKLIVTLIYIVVVISFQPDNLSGLMVFTCFPIFLIIIGEIPIKLLITRCSLALPFAFFAGVSNLFLDQDILSHIGGLKITYGMVTFGSLMLKAVLTVMAVLLLAASSSMNKLIYALINLRVPSLLVIQLMMTYRYMNVLLNEASLMYHAYLLRAPRQKGIKMKDMGTFLGQLILRSTDRAERIYHAMQCRGFEGRIAFSRRERLDFKGRVIVVIAGGLMILLRLIPLSELIGGWFLS